MERNVKLGHIYNKMNLSRKFLRFLYFSTYFSAVVTNKEAPIVLLSDTDSDVVRMSFVSLINFGSGLICLYFLLDLEIG